MCENKQFEKISFWQLLAKTKIEIPIIQRDYAQGREKQAKIRDKFLAALYEAITGQGIELDFIYGSEEKNALQPLDGQQRLTTLFLLHWFIATKENKINETVKERLTKFTYETRTSSREFCKDLIEKGISVEKNISVLIKNAVWFVASWEKDPTISAMLIMLDAIQEKFKETADLWTKLIDEQNPPITFLYIKLENFGLSDDLYIKMNARGKQLTTFENFKSLFEKHIDLNNFEAEIIDSNFTETFAHKIDTIWTDLFWQYREGNLIDKKLMNFISGVAIIFLAQEYTKNKDANKRESVEKRIQYLADINNEITPEDFSTKEAFQYLKDCFNKYAENKNAKKNTYVNLWDYCKSTLFEVFIQYNDITYPKRVLFYAQTIYLFKNAIYNQDSFDDWMRVVRNIACNISIDSATTFIGAIGLINELSNGCSDIYDYLSTNKVQSNFASEQIKEEIAKAKIIVANDGNKKTIHNMEDTNFCKGKIDFALYCIDYDIYNNPNVSKFDVNKLDSITKVFVEHLAIDDVSNDFRRAFFTIKDNDFYTYWSSWLYASNSPKYCMIENITELKENFTSRSSKKQKYLGYLKELILQLSQKNIDTIIEDYINSSNFSSLPNWKQRIIREKGLLNPSKKHYIAINQDCWLIPGSRVAKDKEGLSKLIPIK